MHFSRFLPRLITFYKYITHIIYEYDVHVNYSNFSNTSPFCYFRKLLDFGGRNNIYLEVMTTYKALMTGQLNEILY